MRHRIARYQIGRFTSWRKATLTSLARSIILNQSIKTTLARAKAVKPLVEKLVSLAKDNTLAAKRQAFKILCDHKIVSLLFNDIGPRFKSRTGGYTRTIHMVNRRGDNAQMVIFELTEIIKKEPKKKKTKEAKHKDEEAVEESKEDASLKEKPQEPKTKDEIKPQKKFLGGIKNIFKKERDAL